MSTQFTTIRSALANLESLRRLVSPCYGSILLIRAAALISLGGWGEGAQGGSAQPAQEALEGGGASSAGGSARLAHADDGGHAYLFREIYIQI